MFHFYLIVEVDFCFMSRDCMTAPSNSFTLFSQPYLDRQLECYKTIVTINASPAGPLGEFVSRLRMPLLSEFKTPGPCCPARKCELTLQSFHGYGPMSIDELPELFSFLTNYHYEINTRLTKILKSEGGGQRDTIAFVTYAPSS